MAAKAKKPGKAPREGFWHKPYQMHLVADVLLFAGTVALGYALVMAALRLPLFPLREVAVVTPLKHVTPAQVELAVQDSMTGNFFTVNLDKVRDSFEKLPWVRRAAVRRRWPDGIELELEEQEAVAQWRQGEAGDVRLMNPRGELFAAASRVSLPVLAGPPGRGPDVLARFREFSVAVKPLGTLQSVSLSAREAWSLHLESGLTVELGRDQPKAPLTERLARFVTVYGETAERIKAPMVMADLRYPNGFAVRLGRQAASESKGKQ